MQRREFIKTAAVTTGAALGAARVLGAQSSAPANPGSAAATPPQPATIGIATAVAPVAGPDYERVLDDMKARAHVNAVFPFIYNHNEDRAGIPAARLRGGNFAMPHMQYYKDCGLTFEDMRAPDYGNLDVFERLIPAAKQRGIKVYAWILEDNRRPNLPNWVPLYEVDCKGQRATRHPGGPCNNNPQYRNYLLGLVEDYCRSYDIGGVMWGSERQGGLLNALGAYHNGARSDPGQATCFCEFCVAKAKSQGIDPERARTGFVELEKFVRAGRAGQRPRDGYFVAFWRLLTNHPELLAWESFWNRSRNELKTEIYAKVKSVNPALPVGWHIWHNVSFSPFHRAEIDYAELATHSDFIRPVLYSNCAGERLRSFVDSTRQNVFGDLPPGETLDMLERMLNYNEAPYDRVAAAGLSADYVARETRRVLEGAGAAGKSVEAWPGVDIDVPVGAGSSQCTPESIAATVKASFQAGARGIVLSRNYIEMKPEHLAAAGAALKELGVAG